MRRARIRMQVILQKPLRAERLRIRTVHGRVAAQRGQVGEHDGALRHAPSLVGVLGAGRMRHAERADRRPAVDFFDQGADVGEARIVVPGGEAGAADDAVKFCWGGGEGVG